MSQNKKYDLFIAYYGNAEDGSETRARELYHQIQDVQIVPGWHINAYFHPVTNPYGRFEETPMIVARTPMFLLVVDKDIPTSDVGQLLCQREDGSLRNLYEEVRAFHDSMYKADDRGEAAKLFITDSFDFKAAERLHTIFTGTIALSSARQVLEWIRYFYANNYCDQVYRKCSYLVKRRREEFCAGKWVPEAEKLWRFFRNEQLGRSLLIYHSYYADLGDKTAIGKLRALCREFNDIPLREESTRNVLGVIKEKLRSIYKEYDYGTV